MREMGTPDYIIGITNQIRKTIGKTFGDEVEVVLKEREEPSLWRCPKCGREFKKRNQSHYCGEKPKTIDEYIMMQDEGKRADLRLIYQTLKDTLPEAEERISWSMPTFWKNRNLLQFAASKNHIGFYPGAEAVAAFREELLQYKTDKGTIRIPYGKVDSDLIARIAKWCLETRHHV